MSPRSSAMVSEAQSANSVSAEPSDSSSISDDILTKLINDEERKKKIYAWCMQQYHYCKEVRRPVERDWYLWMAFYFGRQNVRIIKTAATSNGFQLIVPPAPPWRVRLVINRIRKILRKQVALVTQEKPRFFAIPSGTSDEDLMSARAAEAILDSFYREKHVKNKLKSLAWWGSINGTAFFKTYWDANKKDSQGNKGDICGEVIPSFYLFVPNLLQPDIELQPYVIHATTISPEVAKRKYSLEVEPNVTVAEDLLEDQFMSFVRAQKIGRKDHALNLEFWIKPGLFNLFPNGALVTICGDKVVQIIEDGIPYEHGEYPFARFTDIDSGGFYGISVIEDLISPQRELNRTRSQITEAKNLMAKPKLLAARGSINPDQITSEPGQVITYTPGYPEPRPLALTPLPNYVLQEVDRLISDIEDLSGQHDIAKLISDRTAATAISYVQNADSTVIESTINSMESCVEKIGRHVLALCRQYWTNARAVKIVGPDEAFEVQNWKGSTINKYTEVYVEPGSAMPQDRSARQAFLMDLFKLGAIKAEQMLEMLEVGGIEKVYEDYLVDKRQAQRENVQMVQMGAQADTAPPDINIQQIMLMAMMGGNNVNTAPGGFAGPDSSTISNTPAEPGPAATFQ